MKFKKIIKGIMGVGVVGGIAYLAYKIGETMFCHFHSLLLRCN